MSCCALFLSRLTKDYTHIAAPKYPTFRVFLHRFASRVSSRLLIAVLSEEATGITDAEPVSRSNAWRII